MNHCVAPEHVGDETTRMAKRQKIREAKGRGNRPNTCPYDHDQRTHGRLQRDGRPYCAACKRDQKQEPEAQRTARARAREATRDEIAALLRKDVPQMHIAAQLGVAAATVQHIREALGLPAPTSGPRSRYASIEEAFSANTGADDDGHLRWTGYTDAGSGTPYVCFRQQRMTAARLSFQLHHGRAPVGQALPSCEVRGCLAGGHLADRVVRAANQRADQAFAAIFGVSA